MRAEIVEYPMENSHPCLTNIHRESGIFAYVEEKGMEMDISVKQSRYQAPFMLSALRELREDSRELKKKQKETESDQKGVVLGPLLGPAIKSDKGPATPPPGFEVPENLETVGLEMDLPVGFKRLRWAMLNSESHFMQDAVFKEGSKYEEYVCGQSGIDMLFTLSFQVSISLLFSFLLGSTVSRSESGRFMTRRLDLLRCRLTSNLKIVLERKRK